jgi:hypothetical protein
VADRLSRLPDADLDLALVGLGRVVQFPPEPNVAPAVFRRLRELPAPARGRTILERLLPARPLRRAVALAVAVVMLAGGVAAAGLLGVPGLKLIFRPHASPTEPTRPLGFGLFLGTPVSAERAASEVSFPIARPRLGGLPRPEYYVSRFTAGGEVSLVYPAGPGLPAAPSTRVGLLVFEFQGTVNPQFLRKVVSGGTVVEPVRVHGGAGYWIVGAPHEVMLVDRNGRPFPETVRLAGNTLVWQRGDVTMRIEGRFGKAEAMRIANAVR